MHLDYLQVFVTIIVCNLYIGDLTLQGYEKKKRKLTEEIESPSTASESTVLSSDNTFKSSDVASTLSDTSVHSTLMKLFKPKMDTTNFNPSSIANKVHHGHKKSLKLARKQDPPKTRGLKPITVVLLSPETYTVPKDKKKLREESRMCCCSFSTDDSVIVVNEKIISAFPHLKDDIIYLQTTKSGDLFKADASEYNIMVKLF